MEAFVHTSDGFRLTTARESHVIEGLALKAGGWVIVVSFDVGLWSAPGAVADPQVTEDRIPATVSSASMRCVVEAVGSGGFAYPIGGSDHFVQGSSRHLASGHPATVISWGRFTEGIDVRLRIEALGLEACTAQVGPPRWIAWDATFTGV
jgi:hypothetical protein